MRAVWRLERSNETSFMAITSWRRPRVVVATVDGTRVYRVVMGPFSSRAEADRIGRQSGRDYWVFEGVP